MTFIIGTPHTHQAGYYRNDDRNSGGKLAEADIKTCTHCQAVIKMQEWKAEGAWCAKCEAPVCGGTNQCAKDTATFGCVPFFKKIEQYAEEQMRFAQFSKLAGLNQPVSPSRILTGPPQGDSRHG